MCLFSRAIDGAGSTHGSGAQSIGGASSEIGYPRVLLIEANRNANRQIKILRSRTLNNGSDSPCADWADHMSWSTSHQMGCSASILRLWTAAFALEFDGPSHFTLSTLEPLGHTRLHDRLLSGMGGTLCRFPSLLGTGCIRRSREMHTSSSGSCTILRNALEMRHRQGIGPALASPLRFRSLLRVSIALIISCPRCQC